MANHDLHLSALSISASTCGILERLGFSRDEFANNRYCVASAYHGSYSGPREIPDDELWEHLCTTLTSDPQFAGHLEEEETLRRELFRTPHQTRDFVTSLIPFQMESVPDGAHKECDIHLGIELAQSSHASCTALEGLRMASFDRYSNHGIRRIYTVTCETNPDGHMVFDALCAYARNLPGLVGKIKLEATSRYLRHPESADGLPILKSKAVEHWLSATQDSLSESLR